MSDQDSRELYDIRFHGDDGVRPLWIKYGNYFWDYDPETDTYRDRGKRKVFGNPVRPRTRDWFGMRFEDLTFSKEEVVVEPRGEVSR